MEGEWRIEEERVEIFHTIHFLEHGPHIFMKVVVKEPNGRVLIILLKRHLTKKYLLNLYPFPHLNFSIYLYHPLLQ